MNAPGVSEHGGGGEAVAWRGIDNLPDDERMVLAKCDDGRAMVWRASILARNLRGPTPEHLQFPATKWMPIPGDAAMLASAPAAPGVDAAKHWHDLYRKECRLRQDDAARYGQQIVDLEATAPGAAVGVEGLTRIGELIRTQDNRITDAPIFIVQQKGTVWGVDTDYDCDGFAWLDDQGPVEPRKGARLERLYQRGFAIGKYRRLGFKHYWKFVTACFTEQGCKDYIARNGHNLREPRIYAEGSYRNEEWRAVRSFLSALTPPAAAPGVDVDFMQELAEALDSNPDRDSILATIDSLKDMVRSRRRAASGQGDCVLTPILAELTRATAKFPTWPTDPLHALGVLGEEFGELGKAVLQAVYEPHKGGDVREEAIQTAAMAIRFVASLDRYVFAPCQQHHHDFARFTRPDATGEIGPGCAG